MAEPSVGKMLTQKWGPLPMWQWLAVGAGIFVVWRVFKGQSAPAQTATPTTAELTTATQPSSAGAELQQSIGLLSQLQAFNAGQYQNALQQVQQTAGLTGQLTTLTVGSQAQVTATGPWVSDPGDGTANHKAGPIIGMLPAGATVIIVGNARPAYWTSGETPQYTAVPVQYAGAQGWFNGAFLQRLPYQIPGTGTTQFPPIGGPRTRTRHVPIPGREGGPLWSPHHRALKANPRLQHYAVGGPRDLASIALQTGLHPARLMAANRHLADTTNGRPPWVAAPGQHIRVA